MAKLPYLAFVLDEASRRTVLEAIPPCYPDVRADHITQLHLKPSWRDLAGGHFTDEAITKAQIIAVADDGKGMQVAVIRVGGWTHNLNGNAFHLTISFDGSQQVPESWTADGTPEHYGSRHANCLLREVMHADGWALTGDRRIRRIDPPLELTVQTRWIYPLADEGAEPPHAAPPVQSGRGL